DAVGKAAGGGDAAAADADRAFLGDAFDRDAVGEVAAGHHFVAVDRGGAATTHADADRMFTARLHPPAVAQHRAGAAFLTDAAGVADAVLPVDVDATPGTPVDRPAGGTLAAAGEDAVGVVARRDHAGAVDLHGPADAHRIDGVRVQAGGADLAVVHRDRTGATGLPVQADRVVAGGLHLLAGQECVAGGAG